MTELNACGVSLETIAAEYETDAALTEAGADPAEFPPKGDYFYAALRAEDDLRARDLERHHDNTTPRRK